VTRFVSPPLGDRYWCSFKLRQYKQGGHFCRRLTPTPQLFDGFFVASVRSLLHPQVNSVQRESSRFYRILHEGDGVRKPSQTPLLRTLINIGSYVSNPPR